MVQQEKLKNPEDGSEETPEQAEFSKQLHRMAENMDNKPEKHEEHEHETAHSHEETQEQKNKMADEIIARAEGFRGKPLESAKMLAEEVRIIGQSHIRGLQTDYANLAEKDSDGLNLKRLYPDWKRADFESLYYSLYGEDVNDYAKKRRENGEKIRRMQQEDAEIKQKAEEQKKRQEEEKLAKFRKKQEERQAEDTRKKRWFGLGRFFK